MDIAGERLRYHGVSIFDLTDIQPKVHTDIQAKDPTHIQPRDLTDLLDLGSKR